MTNSRSVTGNARPPIAEGDRFYQRLLAHDEDELSEMAEKCVREHSLDEAFDSLLLPALWIIPAHAAEDTSATATTNSFPALLSMTFSQVRRAA